jgi:UDP-N-acetylmuramoyl-L-alanyl-D-glutamate--2,6-diaminopimelate ligase
MNGALTLSQVRLMAAQADALVARLAPLAGITSDSRRVAAQVAFAAYPGDARDGRAFIGDAIHRGAAAVLFEARGFDWDAGWRVPHAAVADLKMRLGFIASAVYGRPSQTLWMVGVTGTNGKTSCAHWTAQALTRCGRRSAVIGTLGNGFVESLSPSSNTTPDACITHELLAAWLREGASAVAMEVSSHGLDQHRVNGIAFDVALFTNLTRDHLDYHGTMEAYGEAKARLLQWPGLRTAVINMGDAFGRELIRRARSARQRVVTYAAEGADLIATRVRASTSGMAIDVAASEGRGTFETTLVGQFNVQNLLGVLGVLLASDVALDDALDALAHLTPPAGRMQRFGGGEQPIVVVDYAHTPDALQQVLQAVRPALDNGARLFAVFGCGGDRDRGKRADMGAVAGRLADRVFITNDNPRTEDPRRIADDVVQGLRGSRAAWTVELDRGEAIEHALDSAQAGDIIVVAGKGHEDYQETNGERIPFSDARYVADALARRRAE